MVPELVDVPGGVIELRDEGTRRTWEVAVAPFRLGRHPVTAAEYAAGRGAPPPAIHPRLPVTEVSWFDAVRFCNALSAADGLRPCYVLGPDPDGLDCAWDPTADGHRLPTEAEWEHACRAGDLGVRYGGLDAIAWHRATSGGRAHDVGLLQPNAFGLHDTIGNVWEWCWDLFDPAVYGPYRLFRGGGWADLPRSCRASCRRKSHPTFRVDDLGFRVARNA
ncbi:MAG TPA: SUMF1/EgtB/PvdO family nonheme iron enzyme [Pseudonocardiaceae bacterium]